MKKILFLFAAAICTFAACDPVHEDISNGGHITVDDLKAKTSVTVDKDDNGKWGNVITCTTSAPVNAKWDIGGKEFVGNSAMKKMKVNKDEAGNYEDTKYTVTLTALCPDGTELKTDFSVTCQVITNELQKIYIYGDPENAEQVPVTLGLTDPAAGRFSDSEGKYFPYLSDDVYYGLKTLLIDITDVQEGENPDWGMPWGPAMMRVMTGWWSPQFMDDFEPKVGLLELPITQEMAEWCAHSNKPDADGNQRNRDLTLMMTRGSVTIKSIYYEE